MSQKVEKPSLSGQRIKTRKRDEKEKYDPIGFRDAILTGLEANGCSASDLEGVHKYLDSAGNKLDYRRYAEVLFDLIIAGGILAPGGSIVKDVRADGQPGTTEICVFCAKDAAQVKGYANLLVKLIRRYKYLERSLEESFGKVMMFMRGFDADQREKLAAVTAFLLTVGLIPTSVLSKLLQDHLIKDGCALNFLLSCLKRWSEEKDAATIWSALRRYQLEQRLMEFMPVAKRTEPNLTQALSDEGLSALVDYHRAHACQSVKRELQSTLKQLLEERFSQERIIDEINSRASASDLSDSDVVVLLWTTLMNIKEWNKKQELAAEQSVKYLRQEVAPLLAEFAGRSQKAEMALMRAIQEYCYDNINFLKVFQKIVVLLYKCDVLSEDTILKWYSESHSAKGKSVFLDQMKPFIEWLKNAEEEDTDEDDD
ncbi:protein krasavietz-like [Varroa jacobsoni]|uniref:W2 domain-containing protein n=1 Tax=Varroa destructor TaxID=109461 RepID=A0A7M7KL76_VARDE|nr:protein krasavietz-like [Varroa destructor]XP_022667560.1 protein krasavietz-like [Varroa destructor]XP_022703226.1 protein krasavietz-like [Varroa jacobsoni]